MTITWSTVSTVARYVTRIARSVVDGATIVTAAKPVEAITDGAKIIGFCPARAADRR